VLFYLFLIYLGLGAPKPFDNPLLKKNEMRIVRDRIWYSCGINRSETVNNNQQRNTAKFNIILIERRLTDELKFAVDQKVVESLEIDHPAMRHYYDGNIQNSPHCSYYVTLPIYININA
jgi:hypothetical protein